MQISSQTKGSGNDLLNTTTAPAVIAWAEFYATLNFLTLVCSTALKEEHPAHVLITALIQRHQSDIHRPSPCWMGPPRAPSVPSAKTQNTSQDIQAFCKCVQIWCVFRKQQEQQRFSGLHCSRPFWSISIPCLLQTLQLKFPRGLVKNWSFTCWGCSTKPAVRTSWNSAASEKCWDLPDHWNAAGFLLHDTPGY